MYFLNYPACFQLSTQRIGRDIRGCAMRHYTGIRTRKSRQGLVIMNLVLI